MSLPIPITRKEQYLSAVAGNPDEVPEYPITREEQYLAAILEGGGDGGTTDYEALINKPTINGETLSGNKTAADLGLVEAETGKGLSTNDFTDERKNKLDGMEAQANKTLIDDTMSNAGQAADAKASGDAIASLQRETALLRELIDGVDAPIYRAAGPGNPVVFTDGAAANVKALSVEITPAQSGSGDPSPDNIRPITGLSSVSVSGIGKNLFDPSGLTDGTNWSVDADGVYSGYGWIMHEKYSHQKGGYPLRVAFREGVPYTLSFDFRAEPNEKNSYGVVFGLKFTDGTETYKVAAPSPDFQSVILTTPPGKTLLCVYCSYSSGPRNYVRNIQLEEGSEATGYEPYRERSVAVPLADSDGDPLTVYGGTLDVTTGTLTVTHAKASASKQTILKSGSDTTGAIPFYKINNSNWPDYVYTNADTSRREELCNIAKIANPYNSAEAANYGDYLAIIMSADGSSTPKSPQMRVSKAVVDAMGNDTDTVEITYPLANPVTYQLTGQDLATLPGYNAVLTDADSVSVQYRADPTLAYEELESSLTNAILSLGANF